MRFMLLMKSGPNLEADKLPDPAIHAAMSRFNQRLQDAGARISADGLKPSKEGVRLSQTNGDRTRVDGPFAEAREVVAGFWIIDVPTLADAIAWVKQMPFEEGGPVEDVGEVEIRPFWELPGAPPFEAPPVPAGMRRFISWVAADAASERGEMGDPELFVAMDGLVQRSIAAGRWGGGDGLRPSSESAKVVFGPGKREVIDGPFAETKELVAGYAILYARDLEDMVQLGWDFLAVDAPGRGGHSHIVIQPFYEASDFA